MRPHESSLQGRRFVSISVTLSPTSEPQAKTRVLERIHFHGESSVAIGDHDHHALEFDDDDGDGIHSVDISYLSSV